MKVSELEAFRLRSLDLGQLTGASMAIHAVPDAYLLKHTGVGCKHKTVTQFGTHELGRGVAAHEGWTEVGDAGLIRGSGERIGPYVRSAWQRHQPAVIAIASVTFLDLTGDDFPDLARALDAELPCHVVFLKVPGYEGDLWSGYLTTMLALCERLDWSQAVDRPQDVAFLGYLWDRYEGDHQGNLAQIQHLLKGIGLQAGPVLLSGRPMAELADAPRAGVLARLPYATPKAKRLKKVCGRDAVAVDLPIGLGATAAFLRALGTAGGVATARVDAFITRQEASVRERVGTLADRLRGRRVAVLADLPLLAGVCGLLAELGMEVRVAGIRGHTLGGEAALRAALARSGAALPEGCVVLEDPSIARVRDVVGGLLADGGLDGVLGSATDLNGLANLSPAASLARVAGRGMQPEGPFLLEIGFPCRTYHCATPMPTLGYGGVLTWVQRLLTAPRAWDAGRAGQW